MKLRDAILNEAPLPPDWDEDIYDPNVPFAQRVRYAKERAEQIGRGSSRVVFQIPYKGRLTALKVASNRKGMAQNEVEAEILSDGYARQLGIVVPIIDYDERSHMPTWIHTELAPKLRSKQQFERMTGVDMDNMLAALMDVSGRMMSRSFDKSIHENEFYNRVQDLVMNFDLPPGDLARAANWGVYRNRPVIIDVGLTQDVYDTHYS